MADYRERHSKLTVLLENMGVTLAYSNLTVADYLVSNSVAIERKTPSDLVASILDGRFTDQVSRLLDAYGRGILLVTGGVTAALDRSPNPGLVYSRLAWCALRGASLLVLESDEAAAALMIWLVREAKDNWTGYDPMIKRKPRNRSTEQQVHDLLTTIPGIGPKRAKKLMEAFPSLREVFEAPTAKLSSLLGPSAAGNLKAVFTSPLSASSVKNQSKLTEYLDEEKRG